MSRALPAFFRIPARTARRARPQCHPLEDRTVPAITATYDAPTKELRIVGDTASNEILVEVVAGKVEVSRDFVTGTKVPVTIDAAPLTGLTLLTLSKVIVTGDAGNDTITIDSKLAKPASVDAGAGFDSVSGGAGNDTLIGGADDDLIMGGKGNDSIDGGAGVDDLQGQAGNDTLLGGADNDNLVGGAGNDSLDGGTEADTLFGDDESPASKGNDTIKGGADDDTILAGAGNDVIDGGKGNDEIEGQDGNDSINAGPDTVDGAAGEQDQDVVYAGAGNDTVKGGAGDDQLYGEAGGDSLVGGAGQDTLSGGFGRDVFVGHGTAAIGTGLATDEANFDTYKDEFDFNKPVFGKAEVKDVMATEGTIQETLAALAAIASGPANFNMAGRIRYLGSGEFRVRVEEPTGQSWVNVLFDGTWTDNDPLPNAGERFLPPTSVAEQREFWTVLFTRARLAWETNGAYDPLSFYTKPDFEALSPTISDPGDAVFDLAGGNTATQFTFNGTTPPTEFTFGKVQGYLSIGDWITVRTGSNPVAGLLPNQTYALVKAFSNKAGQFFTLYNVLGFDRGGTKGTAFDANGPIVDDGLITIAASTFFNSDNFTTAWKN